MRAWYIFLLFFAFVGSAVWLVICFLFCFFVIILCFSSSECCCSCYCFFFFLLLFFAFAQCVVLRLSFFFIFAKHHFCFSFFCYFLILLLFLWYGLLVVLWVFRCNLRFCFFDSIWFFNPLFWWCDRVCFFCFLFFLILRLDECICF